MSRHAAQPSVSSVASRPRAHVSRTETNATDITSAVASMADMHSIRTLDQLSTARASVTMLDKLWTQIDVLDDVKTMAQQVEERGSFLSDQFITLLVEMKESQQRLLDVMVTHTERSEKNREQRRQEVPEDLDQGDLTEEVIKKDSENTRKRMQEFFFSHSKTDDDPQGRDFDELNEYVGDVRLHMGDVGERMKHFDDEMKKLW